MVSYPNQKLYHIRKRIEEGDIFIMLKWEDYTAAARELSPSALNLFMYLAKNQDNYEFYFSSKDYCQTFDVVDKTFRNARNELINKGYLKEGDGNHVYFDAKGFQKEGKKELNEKLVELGKILSAKDNDRYNKVYEMLQKANLKEIKDEKLYIIKIKEIISFTEDLIKEISENEFSNLLN